MKAQSIYSDNFFEKIKNGSVSSADVIVPILLEMIKPSSVIDVGCGTGSWLSVFSNYGVRDILGVDGDWVRQLETQVPRTFIRFHDLEKPFSLDRTFDMAISLEVAEHLTASRASGFVFDLTRLAPIIVFSAAVPYQRGVGHINEQWPNYWAAMFKEHDFHVLDAVRWKIWDNPAVSVWYAQNILVFATKKAIAESPELSALYGTANTNALAVVHPRLFEKYSNPSSISLKWLLSILPDVARQTIMKRMKVGSHSRWRDVGR